jgi:hypothetical protein
MKNMMNYNLLHEMRICITSITADEPNLLENSNSSLFKILTTNFNF